MAAESQVVTEDRTSTSGALLHTKLPRARFVGIIRKFTLRGNTSLNSLDWAPTQSPGTVPLNHDAVTHRLPVELLSEVLTRVVHSFPALTRENPLLLITSICRLWRDVALSLPKLWMFIRFNGDKKVYSRSSSTSPPRARDRIRAFLARSKNLPIDVDYRIRYSFKSIKHLELLRDIIFPHLSRCRTLFIQVNTTEQVQHIMPLPNDVRMLQNFQIHLEDTRFHPPSTLITLFAPGNGINLRGLSISSIHYPLRLDSITATELQSLKYSVEIGSPNLVNLLQWLESASSLEELVLADSLAGSPQPVILPRLRSTNTGFRSDHPISYNWVVEA
ncbi:hypothetical protein DL93DRAFT_2170476 [Clavulina sp. PMI_390]|nr:hypothetical protein DL93DRAFT_2170476 [Clavulina sp. PMI_390]